MSDIIEKCPYCEQLPTIGIDAVSNKNRVACMNICCANMTNFVDKNIGKAMIDWNNFVHKFKGE